MKANHSEFLAKGSYGCVFYPSINACSGTIDTDIDSDHYITKIQKYSPNEDDEIKIGKQLQKLPLYDHYFAPIIKSCKMNISNMDYNLVKTCATMQNELGELNSKSAYVSNKIRYVGKNNIHQYFQSIKSNHKKLYVKIINTHLHLLDALSLLISEHIVHFDIKPHNIMYDEIQNVPIIIDFGLSRSIKPLLAHYWQPINTGHLYGSQEAYVSKLAEKRYKDFDNLLRRTFVTYESYDYWCIDIYILSNIGLNTFLKPHQRITIGHIKTLTSAFITPIFTSILYGDEVVQFKQKVLDYFMPFIDEDKTWMDMYKILIQNYQKWDNYSIAVSYLHCYSKCKPTKSPMMKKQEPDEIQLYISLLKNIVIAMPNERPTHVETYDAIKNIFNSAKQTDNKVLEISNT